MSTATSSMGTWNDFGALTRTRAQATTAALQGNAEQGEEALRSVARQFESLFIQMMLTRMREASLGDPLFDGPEMETYREMLDQQVALNLGAQGGLGIADMLVRQLSPLVRQAAAAGNAPVSVPNARLSQSMHRGTPHVQDASGWPGEDDSYAGAGSVVSGPAGDEPLHSRHRVDVGDCAAVATAGCHDSALGFDGPEDFVARVRPHAQRVAASLGVPAEVLIAQAALETGWGQHMIRGPTDASANNFFGIKADRRWHGPSVNVTTMEFAGGVMQRVRAPFRAYASAAESFDDYAHFITGQERYRGALEATRRAHGDPQVYIHGLQEAGYATDPDYAQKVVAVMKRTLVALETDASRSL